jgi:hypothetical protein
MHRGWPTAGEWATIAPARAPGARWACRMREADRVRVLVAVTGWGEADERFSAAFAHMDHHLRKPVSGEQLRELLLPPR